MKNIYSFASFLLLLLLTTTLSAQDCDNPLLFIDDDMESYNLGDVTNQATHWNIWPGAPAGGEVSEDFAESGTKSVKIDGNITDQDVLVQLGNQTAGHYVINWDMYIPDSSNLAYFNIQHMQPTATEGFWAMETFFDGDGAGSLDFYGAAEAPFTYPIAEWFKIYLVVDITNDQIRLLVDENTVAAWPFTNAAGTPSNQLNSINFYPANADHLFYIDNLQYAFIQDAGIGDYCYTALDAVVGTNTVADLKCFGAGLDLGGDNGAFKGAWFKYTPSENGIMTISSCGGGADTRGWILRGDCQDLEIMGVNDDLCDRGDGSDFASFREAVVEAGVTYYIMWDNPWDDSGFDFELLFRTDAPEAGEFCESAIAVDLGEHLVDEMTGNSSVAGPNINTFTTSTTPYSQSKWYSFTPLSSGVASIDACDATGDTYVFVYTGECGSFSDLELYAENDDSDTCPENQSYLEFDVTEGETYYIEWIDRFDEIAFVWELCLDGSCTPVAVNEVELENSIQVFPNPASELVNVDINLPEMVDELSVTVFNAVGAQVWTEQWDAFQDGRIAVPVKQLPGGLYFVQIQTQEVQVVRRIVVE